MARNDVFLNINALSPADAVVTGQQDMTAATVPELVLGDTPTFNFYFTDNTNVWPSWAGNASYTLTWALSDAVAGDFSPAATTGNATPITGGWSVVLPLNSYDLVGLLNTKRVGQPYPVQNLWQQLRVTDPSGNEVTRAMFWTPVRYRAISDTQNTESASPTGGRFVTVNNVNTLTTPTAAQFYAANPVPTSALGTAANGELLIGNGTGFTKSTLTAGTGITVTNGSGSITIDASGAQETLTATVTNAEAVPITKGQVVYIFGATGNRPSVKLAYNTTDATSAKTFGVVSDTSIAPNGTGTVTCVGVVDGLNLGAYQDGDTVYLGATPGSVTATKPYAPNHLVYVGIVERANAGNGELYVRVQNGYELDEIHDVQINAPRQSGQTLIYDNTTSLWKNARITAGSNIAVTNGDGSISIGFSGTLPVANGGTGVTTSTGSGSVVLSTSPTLTTPILGTPQSGTLSSCTGLPISTGVSGLGTNVATFLATPSSANLASAVTDETGTGALVFANTPTLTTPNIGAATGTSVNLSGTGTFGGNLTVSGTGTSSVAGTIAGYNQTVAWDGGPNTTNPAFAIGTGAGSTRDLFAFGNGSRIGLLRGYHDGGGTVEWNFGRYITGTFNSYFKISGSSATGDATLSGNLTVSGGTIGTAASTNLTLAGGSSGASLVLGQGSNNAVLTLPSGKLLAVYNASSANSVANIGLGTNSGFYFVAPASNQTFIGSGMSLESSTWIARGGTTAAGLHFNSNSFSWFTDSGLTNGNSFSPTERMRLSTNSNLIIGSPFTDGGQKLQVNGTAYVSGDLTVGTKTGAQSTPDKLQMSSGYPNTSTPTNQQLKISLGYVSATQNYGFTTDSLARIWYHAGDTVGPTGGHVFATGGIAALTLDSSQNAIFAGSTGVQLKNDSFLYFGSTVRTAVKGNSTGSLELYANNNLSLTLDSSANATFAGKNVGIGGASNASVGLYVQSTLNSSTNYGITSAATFGTASNNIIGALYAKITTTAASFTVPSGIGLQIDTPTIGAASAITTNYGLKIENQTGGGTNYAIHTNGGYIRFGSLPTSSAGLPAGTVWNDAGTLKIA